MNNRREEIHGRPDSPPERTSSRSRMPRATRSPPLQLERMKWSLRHAYENSRFYRKRFDDHGRPSGRPEDASRPGEVSVHHQAGPARHLPVRHVRRAAGASSCASMPPRARPGSRRSSATPRGDIDTWADLMARSIRAAGGRPGDIVHVAYGYGLFTGGLGAHYGAERLGCTVVPMSGGMTERQVQLINDFKPRHHHGDAVLHAGDPRRVPPPGPRPAPDVRCRSASSAPSRGPTPCAPRSSRRFDMHAVDIYGLSEVMGPGVASECVETKDGLHIWEDHFYPEIIDPVTGEVLPDGEIGELVFTSLTKEAMPMIRYRTRDLTRLLPRHGAVDAPDGEDHRPLRRHDDHARRQRLPDPDRGADPEVPRPGAALPDRADALGPDGQHGRACGVRSECRGPGCPCRIGKGTGAPHQERCRG